MTTRDAVRAAMAEVDAYYKERGIFQGKFGFGVSPALIVIDMAYGWTDPAYAGGSARLDTAITALQQLLPAARVRGVPVFYTTSAATTSSISTVVRAVTAMRAPARARASAIARPMPRPPPVTNAM